MEFDVRIKLKNSDSCDGCPLVSCGHFGDPNYCLIGLGKIKGSYRVPKDYRDYYWVRPKKCITKYGKYGK